MEISISQLTVQDFESVDELMKRNSATLGFLPEEAILDHIDKGGVFGAKTGGGQLIGYLLYATYPNRFRIVHLCVSDDYRGQGIAKRLVDKLKTTVTTQKVIKLHCRRDFLAHKMWPKLGFIPLGEKPGRSVAGSTLILWCLTLAPDDQLNLFQTRTSDKSLDVVVDAQIFFDWKEEDNDKSRPSKALLSDFLIDSVQLYITDELLNEIDRNDDPRKREQSRQYAFTFQQARHDLQLVGCFEESLTTILPNQTQSQQSDIRQLAKTAASDIDTFVTRDKFLLRKSEEIFNLTNLRLLSPTELILQLHEISNKQSYTSTPISGVSLIWIRLTAEDLSDSLFTCFLEKGEKKQNFRVRLESFISNPSCYNCELLKSGDEIIMIRVLSKNVDDMVNSTLTIHLGRVAKNTASLSFSELESYFTADTIYKTVREGCSMVKFEENSVPHSGFLKHFIEKGFMPHNGGHVRFCLPFCRSRKDVLSEIGRQIPELVSFYEKKSSQDDRSACTNSLVRKWRSRCGYSYFST